MVAVISVVLCSYRAQLQKERQLRQCAEKQRQKERSEMEEKLKGYENEAESSRNGKRIL